MDIALRFYGTVLVVSTMLLLGVASLILFTYFPLQNFWAETIFLFLGLLLFVSAFHEFCHLVALVVTRNQDIVRGLRVSLRTLGIRYEGEVPAEDVALVYLSSLLTVPVASCVFYFLFKRYLLRFLPVELASQVSILIAAISIPLTLVAMNRDDISEWRRLRLAHACV